MKEIRDALLADTTGIVLSGEGTKSGTIAACLCALGYEEGA